jgi:hypothetical protein
VSTSYPDKHLNIQQNTEEQKRKTQPKFRRSFHTIPSTKTGRGFACSASKHDSRSVIDKNIGVPDVPGQHGIGGMARLLANLPT